MQTMQDRILAKIEAVIETANLEPVKQTQWANTGSIFAMDDLDTVLAMRYQFNDTYCSLDFSGPVVDAAQKAGTISDETPTYRLRRKANKSLEMATPYLEYKDGERIRTLLDIVAELVSQ